MVDKSVLVPERQSPLFLIILIIIIIIIIIKKQTAASDRRMQGSKVHPAGATFHASGLWHREEAK